MSRREKLYEAMNEMLDGSMSSANDYLLAAMFCGLTLEDLKLGTTQALSGPLAIFVDVLRERDQMLDAGDAEAINDLKADVQVVLEAIRSRLLKMIAKGRHWQTARAKGTKLSTAAGRAILKG